MNKMFCGIVAATVLSSGLHAETFNVTRLDDPVPDNVSELSARTNDEGWDTVFAAWLKGSRLQAVDAVFVFSVGGGDRDANISANIVKALDYAKDQGSTVLGIVGRDGGHTATVADHCLCVPTMSADTVTPHAESFQAVVWHLIVSDPRLQVMKNKWESVSGD